MDNNRQSELERVLEETLESDGTAVTEEETAERARERVSPLYEYRVKAERDPIAEETKIIRRMAKEPDNRYDKWVETDGGKTEG
jgi:hypothetical protein